MRTSPCNFTFIPRASCIHPRLAAFAQRPYAPLAAHLRLLRQINVARETRTTLQHSLQDDRTLAILTDRMLKDLTVTDSLDKGAHDVSISETQRLGPTDVHDRTTDENHRSDERTIAKISCFPQIKLARSAVYPRYVSQVILERQDCTSPFD